MRCKHCGKNIEEQEEKAIAEPANRRYQIVWADRSGEWCCPYNDGNEHEPGTPEPGTHIVVEGNPVDGFVFHGIPAFQDHDGALKWAEDNCGEGWWVVPLQDVEE